MNSIGTSLAPQTGKVLYFEPPVRLLSNKIFTGCNLYHTSSVIRQRVSLGPLTDEKSSLAGEQFASTFLERFLGLKSLVAQNGFDDKFIAQLRSQNGADFSEILLQGVLAVETALAFARSDLDTIAFAAIERHTFNTDLIWSCTVPKLSRGAAEAGLLGILDLLPRELLGPQAAYDLPSFDLAVRKLLTAAQRRRLSPTTSVLKLAAKKRGLPCEVMGPQHLRLGQGKLQHQIYSSMTNTTSGAAERICADKFLTNRRLAELHLPVPKQVKVGSAEAAHAATAKLGFPIVIKPLKGKKGGGMTAGLTTTDGVDDAFERAHQSGSDVLVERFVPGADHRLLVIGGRFVAALTRRPPSITGDGKTTVAALIDTLNADPWRDGFRLFTVEIDAKLERLLDQAGLSLRDVLSKGRTVVLRSAANVSTGGTPIDVTDQVHPDNREMAERAAKGADLEVAGIDFLTTDISRSYREVGGGIVELNAQPGLCMHIWPKVGNSRNVAGEVLKLSLPPDNDGRIPVVAVAGDKGTGTVARYLDTILRGAGKSVALALRARSFVNGAFAELTNAQQAQAALTLLSDPEIDTLVSTVSLRQAARRGLLLEKCALAVLLNKVREEETELFHTGLGIVKRATTDCFVVSSGNVVALESLRELGARRLILVSDRLNDPALQAHLNAGHAAVTTMWQEGEIRIVLLFGNDILASFPADVGSAKDGRAKKGRLKSGKMFAIASAFGLGLSASEIAAALREAPVMVPESE